MARRLSLEHRERISRGLSRYHQVQRELARVQPRDLAALRASSTVPERLRPLLDAAAVEAAELLDALGGTDRISPQQRALVEDTARLGLVLRASLVRFVQSGDGDAGARVGSLAGQRRATLQALGLQRHAEEVPGLGAYLAQRETAQDAPGKPIDASSDALSVQATDLGEEVSS